MTASLPPESPQRATVVREERAEERRLHLGTMLTGGVLVLVGAGWLVEQLDLFQVEWSMLLPALVVMIGLALLFGARRAHVGGLVFLGIVVLAAALLAQAFEGVDVRGPVGDQRERPATIAQLDDGYAVGAGSLRLDLTDIDAADYDGTQQLRADVGMGEMRIIVPDGVEVRLEADVAMGEARLFDDSVSGFGSSRTLESEGYDGADARIEVDGNVGMGSLRIERG